MNYQTTVCPKCGKCYYTIGMSYSTCAYYPPIIKNGVNINPDRNIHTTEYHCLECGCDWEQQSNGKQPPHIIGIKKRFRRG